MKFGNVRTEGEVKGNFCLRGSVCTRDVRVFPNVYRLRRSAVEAPWCVAENAELPLSRHAEVVDTPGLRECGLPASTPIADGRRVGDTEEVKVVITGVGETVLGTPVSPWNKVAERRVWKLQRWPLPGPA